jgi:tRNA A-37 threonylcarbamoyl transferase component Bud32
MVGAAGSGSPPRLFHDRYRLESRIATGGMGTVYAAVDERLGRRVALKLLRDDLARDPAFVERFRREARAVAALAHPNIAGVFDYGEEDGNHFIVMELAEGRDLARVLREEGPLSPDRAARIAEQICDALAHAHAAGVVHRDVKPANVIVGEQDLVKVTDFGIARMTGDATLTTTGSVLGSAHYISPEQANGAPAGPASDIYSTGIVVFEMLTGSLPFTGDSPIGVAMRHVTDDVPRPSTINPNVGAALDVVVTTATARAPEDRHPDAAAMAAALQAAVGGGDDVRAPVATAPPWAESTTAPPTDPGQTVWPIPGDRWDPQRIGRIVAIAFAVLFAIAVALVVLRVTGDDVSQREGRRRAERGALNGAAPRATQPETTPAPAPTVPDLVGELFEDAEATLSADGFDVDRNDLPSEEVEVGRVIDTTPPPGSAVTPGQTITLIVSAGPEDEEEDEGDGEDEGPPGHGGDPPGQAKKGKGKDG